MTNSYPLLLQGLRASADPTRLRLLAILALGEFTVSELTEVLGQSQPRVSRHLRLLAEGGLLERMRELHWVYYRIPAAERGQLAQRLLELLDGDDPAIVLDRERALAVLERRVAQGKGSSGEDPLGVELAEVTAAELGEEPLESLLYLGPSPAAVLEGLAPRARRVLGLCASHPAVQAARLRLRGRKFSHCVLRQGDLRAGGAGPASCDAVLLDRALPESGQPEAWLEDAARLLRPDGRLVLVEEYEALARRVPGGNPLAALREWIERGGLRCRRLRPVDLDRSHLLMAVAGTVQAGVTA